jgi:hypothetical protein
MDLNYQIKLLKNRYEYEAAKLQEKGETEQLRKVLSRISQLKDLAVSARDYGGK